MVRQRLCVAILMTGVLFFPSDELLAQIELSQYDTFMREVVEGHQAVEGSTIETLPAALQEAVARDTAMLAWLHQALESEEFDNLQAEQRLVLVQTKNRVQYLRAGLYIRQGRCDDAMADVREVLTRENLDQELQARLAEMLDDVVQCVPAQSGLLRVECTPEDARVFLDGRVAGRTTDTIEVTVGGHLVVLRADGFADHTLNVTVAEVGEVVEIGPVLMEELASATPQELSNDSQNAAESSLESQTQTEPLGTQTQRSDATSLEEDMTLRVEEGSGIAGPVVLTVIGAGLVASAVGLALGPFSEATDTVDCSNRTTCNQDLTVPEVEQAFERAERLRKGGIALYTMGGVLVAAGVLWAILRPGADQQGENHG